MSNIYFSKKGCTVKACIECVWPTRYLHDTPKQALLDKIEPGLFSFVYPTCVKKTHYQCAICVIHTDNLSWRYREHLDYWSMDYKLTAHATYEKGRLTMNVAPCIDDYAADCERFWTLSHDALRLIRKTVTEIDKYFPTKPIEGLIVR